MTKRICLCCNEPHQRQHRYCQPCQSRYVRELRHVDREQQTINFFKNLAFWVSKDEAPQQ